MYMIGAFFIWSLYIKCNQLFSWNVALNEILREMVGCSTETVNVWEMVGIFLNKCRQTDENATTFLKIKKR